MIKYNPLNDFIFKKVFGDKKNKHLLIEFLNTIVFEKDQIVELEVVYPELSVYGVDDRLPILDLKAKTKLGNNNNIEIQVHPKVDYTVRALFDWAMLYPNQVDVYTDFERFRKTITIHILGFNRFQELENYHNVFKVRSAIDSEKDVKSFDAFEMHFLELEKFKKGLKDLSPGLDKWMEFLKNAEHYGSEHIPEELSSQKGIKDVIEIFDKITLSKEDQIIYDERAKPIWTGKPVIDTYNIDEEKKEEKKKN